MKCSTVKAWMVKSSQTKSLIEADWDANQPTHQMCLIHRDFKHFDASKANHFRLHGKDSSIMRAKLLSIMRASTRPVTMG